MKGYNTAITQDKEDEDLSVILNPYSDEGEESGMSDFTGTLVGLLIILFVVGAWIGMYIIVAVMAQRRNRSVVMWVLLSMIASPLLMMIILLVVGKDNNRFDRFDR